jgi:phage terminase small subunit
MTVSMREKRTTGQDYLTKRVLECARAAHVQIDAPAWSEPAAQDVSELTVTSGSKRQTHILNNLDLETEQRRSYLDRVAVFVVQDVAGGRCGEK